LEQPSQPVEVCADPKHTRQILHNLLSNALRHGTGDIGLRVRRAGAAAHTLIVANRISLPAMPTGGNLGLGLRMVNTLLGLEPDLLYRRRNGGKSYTARLVFPDGSKMHDVGL
jgi:two-component sensor histidine kinase